MCRSAFLLLLYCFFSVFAIITLSSSFEIVCQKQEDCGILSWYRVPLSHSHSLAACKQLITFRFVYILFTVKCAFHSEFLTSIRNIWYEIGLGLNSVIVSTKFPGGKKMLKLKRNFRRMRLNFVSETIWAAKIIAMNRKIPAILLETLESYYEKKRHWLILILDSWPKMSKNTRERNEIAKFYDSMMFRSWQFALSCTWWEKYASEKKMRYSK